MEQAIKNRVNQWMNSSIDTKAKAEISRLLKPENEQELIDSFYKELEFGTGGLRGIMGIGSNRINKYTIGMATQGLANYMKKTFTGQIKVAIAYDSRNNSKYFAEVTSHVFSANGIKVYLFESLRPTPELSFTIRKLGCHGGVVVTASHNPKEYNGYKAYWNDGAQLIPPHDKNVITEVQAIASIDHVKFHKNHLLIETIGEDLDKAYLQMLKSLSLSPEVIKRQKDIKLVYTPIHGTGYKFVPEALKTFGFTDITIIPEQEMPDGNFPTVVYPNPEEASALSMGLAKAKELDADLLMATDPDSDRVGIAVKNLHGDLVLLNGNQTGVLLIDYLLTRWKEKGKLTGKEYVVKTIVTTDLIKDLANSHEVKSYETLTGFKHIAELIRILDGKEKFIGGGEESYGYLVGDQVRDKDAIASCAFIAEMTAFAKEQGKTLYERLIELYVMHGFYKESLISLTRKGKKGSEEIQEMMKNLRQNPPSSLGGSRVLIAKDYKSSQEKNLSSGKLTSTNLASSDALQFIMEDGSKVTARPSGTEPKIKFYFNLKTSLTSKDQFAAKESELDAKMESIKKDLGV